MIASGGCSAAELSASSAVVAVTTSYPAPRRFVCSARRNCGSSSTTRTRGRVMREPRRGQLDGREREHERRPLARPRLEPEPAAVRLGEAPCDRQPEARPALVGPPGTRWNGSKIRSRSVLRERPARDR